MTVALSLECKELREALQAFYDMPTSQHPEEALVKVGNALSRDKTSYEREAELMENVISAAKSVSQKGMMQHTEFCDAVVPGPDLGPSTKPCNCGKDDLDDTIKTLNEFRGKTHPATAKSN